MSREFTTGKDRRGYVRNRLKSLYVNEKVFKLFNRFVELKFHLNVCEEVLLRTNHSVIFYYFKSYLS